MSMLSNFKVKRIIYMNTEQTIILLEKVTDIQEKCVKMCEEFNEKANDTAYKFKKLSWMLFRAGFISIFKKNCDTTKIEQITKSLRYNLGVLESYLDKQMDLLDELTTLFVNVEEYKEYNQTVDVLRKQIQQHQKNIGEMRNKLKL